MPFQPSLNFFLPYQREWIRCGAPIAIGEKSRRIGWTYASAYRAVQRRLLLKTDLFYTSADLTAAREFIEYCQRWARVFNELASDAREQVIDEKEGVTALVLRFSNGARIVAGSSNPKFFRSKGGDADADEYAFHADQRGLFKAMHATAMVWGHQLRLWSTHNGEGSFFNQLCKEAREKKSDECGVINDESGKLSGGAGGDAGTSTHHSSLSTEHFRHPFRHHFRVSILDAVGQGLVERIRGLDAPDPVARRDWLDQLRDSCPDQDTWREEYLCEPGVGAGALLSYELIGACEIKAGAGAGEVGSAEGEEASSPAGLRAPALPLSAFPLPRTFPLYAGFDVGRKRDRSVLWVLERIGDVFHTRTVRVLEATPFSDQESLLHEVLFNRRVQRMCIDSTGIGAMLAERLAQRWGHRVEGVHFTAASKSEMAMPLVRLFQNRLVRIPHDPAIREDLHKVRKTVTTAGNVRLDATRDEAGHADRFWALALAHHASERAPRRAFTLARKPEGW